MGLSFSIPCDPCINKISHWLDERIACIHDLKKNLTALMTTMEELKAKHEDLSRRITREEDRGLQRLAQIQVWLTRTEAIEKEVNDLLSARDDELQKLCLSGFCSKSLKSSYCYGRSVILTLRKVEKLKSEVFDVIVEQAQTSEVQERQISQVIVGQETMLDKAWKLLTEDGVGIIGFHGMGGVGKTTLLTQINNKFSGQRCGFDFVIWVVVSKDFQLVTIQDEIARKIGLGGEEWKQKDKSEKTDAMYNFLRKKRFVLLLDDIWEKLDIAKIGIPVPTTENKCKVAFTTRSQDVCARMGVEQPMEVQCLSDKDAFDLFQKKVGQITLESDPEIPNLARIIARKCHGLPLALDVIGETMSCKKTIQEWRHAIDILTSYAIEFSGMEDQILPLLKYSYDNLKGENIKSCLVYCALFPEDHKILKGTLIEYWISEGFIDGSEGIERAEDKGYEIIGSLVRASLLMEGFDHLGNPYVSMHDVLREMALWIASNLGIQKEAYIVHAGVGLLNMPKVKNWKVVRRMSLMNNKILHLSGSPKCFELTTLLLQNTSLEDISSDFFKSMPKLAVLDLSRNRNLSELPDGISELGSLQYLNLSDTGIHCLPKGLQMLKKLIHLDLGDTYNLTSIPWIPSLHNLKVLKLFGFSFSWDLRAVELCETLEHLEVLETGIHQQEDLKILSSHRLTSCTRYLHIKNMHRMISGISLPVNMNKLHCFSIQGCSILEINMGRICIESKTLSPLQNPTNTCFSSLSKVTLLDCLGLKELTILMFAPNLRNLSVRNAYQLEDIINKEKACQGEDSGIVPFPKLSFIVLENLPELKSIYWSPLPFRRLFSITVKHCPSLKNLPLHSQSGWKGGVTIDYAQREWLERVEWEDQATKTRFLPLCKMTH